jgi:hypothetical protein
MRKHPAFATLALIAFTALTSCSQEEAKPEAAQAEQPEQPEEEKAGPGFHVPDACALLDVAAVTNVSGWKDLKVVKVDTGAEYLSGCNIIGVDPKHFVKISIAIGGDEFKDSKEFAEAYGDRSGTLVRPARAITNLGAPVIEMDGGPEMQAMQSRTKPYTEMTIITPSMQLTRTLFPQALIKLRELSVKDS